MIIKITQSDLFCVDPSIRFANEYKVDKELWKEIWRRYTILDYSIEEMMDYFELKAKRQISRKGMKRWILRTKVYSKTKPVLDKGCEAVTSEFFGDIEWFVLKEVLKNLKSSVHKNPKILP